MHLLFKYKFNWIYCVIILIIIIIIIHRLFVCVPWWLLVRLQIWSAANVEFMANLMDIAKVGIKAGIRLMKLPIMCITSTFAPFMFQSQLSSMFQWRNWLSKNSLSEFQRWIFQITADFSSFSSWLFLLMS